MGRKCLDNALMDLRENRISLVRFFQLAEGDIRRMATALFRRWVLPPAITPEDIYQQMCLVAIGERRERDWKPGTRNKRGNLISISVHWDWHVHTAVKRWLHQQRGAHRLSGSNPTRTPICMAYFRSDDDGYSIHEYDRFESMVVEPEQVDERVARHVLLDVYDELPIPEAVAWAVYVKEGADVDAAAKRIDAAPGLGTTCMASTYDEARCVVQESAKKGRALARLMTNNAAT